MISIFNDSVFTNKCDLLIIPCADDGGVGGGFCRELKRLSLPLNVGKITCAGDISFYPASNKFATAVGYATTVNTHIFSGRSCNSVILQSIYGRIKKKCEDTGWHIVNIPLLGSGYGGMPPKDAYRYLKEAFGCEDCSLQINLYILEEYVYKKVKDYIHNREDQPTIGNVTNNITNTNNFYGGVADVRFQQGTVNASQSVTTEFDYDKVDKIIHQICKYDSYLDNEYGEKVAELRNRINEIEILVQKKENPRIIKSLLREVKNISEGVAGSLIASGIAGLIK